MPRLPKLLRGRLVVAVVLVVGAGLGLWALARRGGGPAVLQVTGTIEATQVEIGAKTTARIREIPVEEGDRVRRGQAILVLDQDEPRADVARLEAAVNLAQAQLRDLLAGARREEIAQAQPPPAPAQPPLSDRVARARL